MTGINRSLFICFFVVMILFMPGLLYFADSESAASFGNIIGGSGTFEETAPELEEEPIEFSAHVYGPDKDEILKEKEEYWRLLAEEREAEEEARVKAARAEQVVAGSHKEMEMLSLVNRARQEAGLPALTLCTQLTAAARNKSRDMINNNYFSHTSPRYGDLGGLLNHHGISYRTAGENLAMNSNGSVRAAHNSLMGSPGHRKNILGRNFTRIGIGIQVKNDGSHYYTQLFVGR